MRKTLALLTVAALVLCGCRNRGVHDGHSHEACGHTGAEAHSHEGHHEDHDTHNHDHEGHDHEGHHTAGEEHDHARHDTHKGHNHEEGHHAVGEEHDHEGHLEGEIVLGRSIQEQFGITTETLAPGPFQETVRTSGRISSASGDETTIIARSSGIVSIGKLAEGSALRKDEALLSISSKDLEAGDRIAKAAAAFEAAKKKYERDTKLAADNIVSESHLDQSKLAYETAKAEYDALTSSGFTQDGLTVRSPIAGYLKDLKVGNGDYVQTGQALATVSRNRRLWLTADLPERHYGLAATISDANFKTSGSDKVYNIKALNGRLLSYGRTSEADYYIPVTLEFDNIGEIVPGSFVDVYLKTAVTAQTLSVPLGAILEEEGTKYVFVKAAQEVFVKKTVTLGQSDGERVRILSGLSEGEEVVVSGAVQVKLSAFKAVPAGHSHSH